MILVVNGFSVRGRLLREKMAHVLRVQNLRFNALLADMPLGVCMFDEAGRLAISNDRYFQMYRLPTDGIAPGTPLREIVRRSKESQRPPFWATSRRFATIWRDNSVKGCWSRGWRISTTAA